MIVLVDEAAGLGLRRVRWKDRVVARVRTSALDRQLAAGSSPESSVPLALHAGRLCEPTARQVLARSLTRIVAAADDPTARRLTAPVHRPAVQSARAELVTVADRLVAVGSHRRAGGGPGPHAGGRRYGASLPVRAYPSVSAAS